MDNKFIIGLIAAALGQHSPATNQQDDTYKQAENDCELFTKEALKTAIEVAQSYISKPVLIYEFKSCHNVHGVVVNGDIADEESNAFKLTAAIKKDTRVALRNNSKVQNMNNFDLHISLGLVNLCALIDTVCTIATYKDELGNMNLDVNLFIRIIQVTLSKL